MQSCTQCVGHFDEGSSNVELTKSIGTSYRSNVEGARGKTVPAGRTPLLLKRGGGSVLRPLGSSVAVRDGGH